MKNEHNRLDDFELEKKLIPQLLDKFVDNVFLKKAYLHVFITSIFIGILISGCDCKNKEHKTKIKEAERKISEFFAQNEKYIETEKYVDLPPNSKTDSIKYHDISKMDVIKNELFSQLDSLEYSEQQPNAIQKEIAVFFGEKETFIEGEKYSSLSADSQTDSIKYSDIKTLNQLENRLLSWLNSEIDPYTGHVGTQAEIRSKINIFFDEYIDSFRNLSSPENIKTKAAIYRETESMENYKKELLFSIQNFTKDKLYIDSESERQYTLLVINKFFDEKIEKIKQIVNNPHTSGLLEDIAELNLTKNQRDARDSTIFHHTNIINTFRKKLLYSINPRQNLSLEDPN